MRESLRARLARFTVKSCLRPALQPSFPVGVQRHWANIATRTPSVPFGVRFSQSSLGGVPTEIVRSKKWSYWSTLVGGVPAFFKPNLQAFSGAHIPLGAFFDLEMS